MLILREAAAAIRRTPLMTVMTAIVIAVSLALIGVFTVLSFRAGELLAEYKKNITIEAYFDSQLSSVDAESMTDAVIKRMQDVSSYQFISKEAALAEYVEHSGEDVARILGYNPFPPGIRVQLHDLSSAKMTAIIEKLHKESGIREVIGDTNALLELEKRQTTLETLTYTMGLIFLLIALAIVSATVRLAIQSRVETIRTMKLLGANRTTVIFPYIIEGTFAGFVGGILGAALLYLFHEHTLPQVAPELVTTIVTNQDKLLVGAAVIVSGKLIGMVGSLFSSLRAARL